MAKMILISGNKRKQMITDRFNINVVLWLLSMMMGCCLHICCLGWKWAIPEKNQTGGVEDMKFLGASKK